MKWIWIYFLCGQEVWSEPSMGARMVPANGQTTKTTKIFYMSFWLERLSILLQIYTFACNFCSRKGGRASIGYRASIGTYTVSKWVILQKLVKMKSTYMHDMYPFEWFYCWYICDIYSGMRWFSLSVGVFPSAVIAATWEVTNHASSHQRLSAGCTRNSRTILTLVLKWQGMGVMWYATQNIAQFFLWNIWMMLCSIPGPL